MPFQPALRGTLIRGTNGACCFLSDDFVVRFRRLLRACPPRHDPRRRPPAARRLSPRRGVR